MPTNAEIHATIDLLIRQPKSSILTNSIADMLDDMVDNIAAGGGSGSVAGIDDVLAEAQALTADRQISGGVLDIASGIKTSFAGNTVWGFGQVAVGTLTPTHIISVFIDNVLYAIPAQVIEA